jgi:type III pantothenate kinase
LEAHLDLSRGPWKAGISSVVPSLTDNFADLIGQLLNAKPVILSAKAASDFKLNYNRNQLGTDRLANVIATRKYYGYPAIVVDMGTATKYDVIDPNGDYLGGLIAPGAASSAESLFARGAQLFPVALEKPAFLIASNTTDALKSGVYYGFVAQVDGIIRGLIDLVKYSKIKIVATGGYAQIFAPEMPLIETVDTALTLKGIEVFSNQ